MTVLVIGISAETFSVTVYSYPIISRVNCEKLLVKSLISYG